MTGVRRWIPIALVGLAAALFAYLNGGERTIINLGVTVLYRVPLTFVVFGSFLLGMVVMFFLGLRHDLRVRRALREAERPTRGAWREAEPEGDGDRTEVSFHGSGTRPGG